MDRLVADAVHLDLLRAHDSPPGLRNENALESALAPPRRDLMNSVYDWPDAGRKRRKIASGNLLDYLRPAGLEQRLVHACPELIGVNEPRARLLLDAHGILLRFAARHQLLSPADVAESHKELARLQHALDRLERTT